MVEIKECTLEDVPSLMEMNIQLLAEMNRQLIEDEKANNSMDISQLKNRMIDFLNNGYKAFFFIVNLEIVGYALCDISKKPIYLRQFFIKREERRKQYGKNAFKNLLEKLGIKEIELDVLQWNETGVRFWEKLGFEVQWKRMKYTMAK